MAKIKCSRCSGSGQYLGAGLIVSKCSQCGGTGRIEEVKPSLADELEKISKTYAHSDNSVNRYYNTANNGQLTCQNSNDAPKPAKRLRKR